jgi:flagellar basal body rod protein FlgG
LPRNLIMSGLSVSAAGMASALRRIEFTAHNIANINTPGFRASHARETGILDGGAVLDSGETQRAAPPTPFEFGSLPGSNVNLAVELVNLLLDRHAFEANADAFRAQSDVLGELLDLTD